MKNGIRILASVGSGLFLICALGCSGSKFSLPSTSASFQQVPTMNNKVDVLFLSDDSSSMLTYRQQMAPQAQAMLNRLNAMGMDYHLAVTTTSVGSGYGGGKFVGNPVYVTPTTPNLASVLTANLTFNLPGSDLEQGLSSVEIALSSPYITGAGAGFLRSDAMLAVIVISDDDDYSSGSVSTYQNFFNSLKPPFSNGSPSWVLNYVGTTQLNAACGQFVNVGSRYIQLATDSNGVAQSVCNADWSVVMSNIQVVISNLLTNYYLNKAPNVSSISVTVNGVVVPKDPTNGWSYQTGSANGQTTYYIQFHGTSIPNLYANVNVSFTPASAN